LHGHAGSVIGASLFPAPGPSAEKPMLRMWWVLPLLLVLCPVSAFAQDGKLQQAREEVEEKPKKKTKEKPSKSTSCSSRDDDDEEDLLAEILAPVVGAALLSPFWAPHLLCQDDFEYTSSFAHYPYAKEHPGYLWVEQGDDMPKHRRLFGGRLTLEDGNDFDGLNRLRGSLFIDSVFRVGLQTNWDYFHERLSCGCTDDAVVSDTNLTFRFAQAERVQMYAGVGLRTWSDRADTRVGWNLLYGGDFFPAKPLILSGVLDVGQLGEATVFRARGTVGVIYHGWELFTGYDFLRIGTANLQGPMIGLRLWF
jgi:hypothetical protein